MLARTAGSLYWIGRYVERAEFSARLIEATLRLDALSARPAGLAAWESALLVAGSDASFAATTAERTAPAIAGFLTEDDANPSSIAACLEAARANAKSVRTALSRDAWEAINRAWLSLRQRRGNGGPEALIALVDTIKAETRAFEGALQRMLRNETYAFIGLGMAVERADNTARLTDVKYHLLLPEGERVGGVVDRDQWTTILHTVSANTAYRWLYREGPKPWLVAELLLLKPEMPRSLAASLEEVVYYLGEIGRRLGRQGEADRLARSQAAMLVHSSIEAIIAGGLHEWLSDFLVENGRLHAAIGAQFRFG